MILLKFIKTVRFYWFLISNGSVGYLSYFVLHFRNSEDFLNYTLFAILFSLVNKNTVGIYRVDTV